MKDNELTNCTKCFHYEVKGHKCEQKQPIVLLNGTPYFNSTNKCPDEITEEELRRLSDSMNGIPEGGLE